jgi:hypothetical protein
MMVDIVMQASPVKLIEEFVKVDDISLLYSPEYRRRVYQPKTAYILNDNEAQIEMKTPMPAVASLK